MAWVHNHRYYQRSIWQNGRVITRSYGAGDFGRLGELIAQEDAEHRLELRARKEEQERHFTQEQRQGKQIQALLNIALRSKGFIRYDRQPWTRTTMEMMQLDGPRMRKRELRERIRALISKAADGDESAAAELANIGRLYPAAFDRELGDHLAYLARISFVSQLSADHAKQDQYLAQFGVLAAELAGETPSAARRRCAEVAAFCYMEYWVLSLSVSSRQTRNADLPLVKRQTAAHSRYMKSLKTLAQIAQAEVRPRRMVIMAQDG